MNCLCSNIRLSRILALNTTVSELEKKQFQPRMERLKAIENDIKNRMEEYALAEERMEVDLYISICNIFLK